MDIQNTANSAINFTGSSVTQLGLFDISLDRTVSDMLARVRRVRSLGNHTGYAELVSKFDIKSTRHFETNKKERKKMYFYFFF